MIGFGFQRESALTEYDKWKTTPPDTSRIDRIVERVSEMQDLMVIKECYTRGIKVADLFEQMRERLIYELVEEDKFRRQKQAET